MRVFVYFSVEPGQQYEYRKNKTNHIARCVLTFVFPFEMSICSSWCVPRAFFACLHPEWETCLFYQRKIYHSCLYCIYSVYNYIIHTPHTMTVRKNMADCSVCTISIMLIHIRIDVNVYYKQWFYLNKLWNKSSDDLNWHPSITQKYVLYLLFAQPFFVSSL